DFDRAKRAKVPIEVATIGDGIDVRADEDRLEGAVSSVESSEDVPRRIDARVKPRLAEQIEREGSSGEIRIGIRDAIDSGGRAADGVELREPSVQAGAVHPEWCLRRTDREGCAWRRAQEWDRGERGRAAEKRAALHVVDRKREKTLPDLLRWSISAELVQHEPGGLAGRVAREAHLQVRFLYKE